MTIELATALSRDAAVSQETRDAALASLAADAELAESFVMHARQGA